MILPLVRTALGTWSKFRSTKLFPASLFLFIAALCLLGTPVRGQTQWPQLKYTEIASVFQPVQVTNAGDGSNRLFIVSLYGAIQIYTGPLAPSPIFLDLTGKVSTGNERGLLSIAFPPGYATKRYFYVAYSRLSDGALVLSRFSVPAATPNAANPASEQVLLVVAHTNDNHYGGQLAFGPDGYLYFGLGDGGSEGDPANNAQNPGLLYGKMLRLDTESGVSPYKVPPTNPFINTSGYRPEIWALGLRNPWRFSFDRSTGDLYIADVGQDSYEEVDFQLAGNAGGQNYGWRILEGTHPYIVPGGYNTSTLTPPAFQYSHAVGDAIIGGFVYRGPASRLSGLYIYGDYAVGTIWGATRIAGAWVTQALDTTSMEITSFGEDEAGHIYVASMYPGAVYQVAEDPNVHPPVLSLANGTYANDQSVTASSTTANVTLHYTTNGADPTAADPVFPTAGLLLSTTTTLKVKGFHAYLTSSTTTEGDYTFTTATPTFSGNSTTVPPETGTNVYLLCNTAGAKIYYTLDGTNPTPGSALYVNGSPIHLAIGPATIRAIAYRTNYQDSAVAIGNWGQPTLATPMINPSDGRAYNGQAAFIYGSGQIHYTIDGSAPTMQSPVFTDASAGIPINYPITIRAISYQYGYIQSAETSVVVYPYRVEGGTQVTASGSGTAGYLDSSDYTKAQYRAPEGVWAGNDGTLYVADTGNHAIRQAAAFGPVITLAGNGTPGFANGARAAATFSSPRGICRDPAGNLFVADDGNHVIRKIDTAGNVTTYAGSGISGSADGPAAQAQFLALQGLTMDAGGNLYVGSLGVIRKVDPQRNVSTFATLPNAGRATVAVASTGGIFATDSSNTVYELSATGGVSVYSGGITGISDGDRTVARYQVNRAVAVDALGIVHLCDGDNIRKILPTGVVITMVDSVANGGTGSLSGPRGVSVAFGGYAYIADTGNNRIRLAYPTDWDRDGIPDVNEGGTTPYVVGIDDRLVDTDGDGQSNTFEFTMGTDPRNPNSRFALQCAPNGAGQTVISLPTIPGRHYQLYYSDDLKVWTALGLTQQGTGNLLKYTQATNGVAQRFYRVTVLVQ